MTIEQEVSFKVYQMMGLYQKFSQGMFEEMNNLYDDDFQGWLYMPWVGELQHFNCEEIKEGNRLAAEYYKDKNISFHFTGLKIVPQSEIEAAVSYEVIHQNMEQHTLIRALALEVWRRDSNDNWRIIRWYEEKGMRV